ncbi:MAG: protein BatD [Calditrichaeota bacterium]|nr:protein BatD [Calditrichota bacterium]
MRRTWTTIVALGLALLAASAVRASVTLESRVDTTTMRIGDVVTYSIIVARDESTQVRLPSLGANLGGFEIRDFNVRKPTKKDGKIVERVDYLISTFDTGDFVIPPVTIQYRTPPDTVWHELRSQPIKIHVASLNPDEAGDIRDIKPPLSIPFDWMRVVWTALLVLVGLAAAVFGFYFVRKRRRGEALFPARREPPRPAHEIALEELDRLFHSDLLERGEIKLFHIRISEIIRRYLEGRFGVPALDMTTSEILDSLRDGVLDDDERETLRAFLEGCDLVKFAKYVPTKEEIDATVERAYAFVRSTQPVEVPQEESPAGGDSEEGAETVSREQQEESVATASEKETT